MATGTVKWFNNAKGYGFVLSEDKGEDLFIHYSSIQMDGYKSLKAGQEVQYDVQEGPKGMHAVNIRSAESSSVDAQATDAAASTSEVPSSREDHEQQGAQEDNLHLNPMHNIPNPSKTSAATNGVERERQHQIEPAVEAALE